jgi:hypothetical protein
MPSEKIPGREFMGESTPDTNASEKAKDTIYELNPCEKESLALTKYRTSRQPRKHMFLC